MFDDYFRWRIERKEDIRELFAPRFYFGCAADDPINAWSFKRSANPMRSRLNGTVVERQAAGVLAAPSRAAS